MRTLNCTLALVLGAMLPLLAWPTLTGNFGRPALVGCFSIAILILSYPNGILTRILSVLFLVYLGEISYSLYLTHLLVRRVLKVLLHPDRFDGLAAHTRLLYFAIYAIAILAAAMALYHLVEQPCRRQLRKVFP